MFMMYQIRIHLFPCLNQSVSERPLLITEIWKKAVVCILHNGSPLLRGLHGQHQIYIKVQNIIMIILQNWR